MVTRAKERKIPTGSAAMALNINPARAKTGWLLRYCAILVSISHATCEREGGRKQRSFSERKVPSPLLMEKQTCK